MNPADLEQILYKSIPIDFFKRTTQAVFLAHETAWKETSSGFAATEATNLRPYIRRAKLEGYMRDAADLVAGVDHSVKKDAAGNWWNHTEIRGGPVVLTQSSVRQPCGPVTKAEFRKTLARDGQLSLMKDVEGSSGHLYALLLHSPSFWSDSADSRAFGHLPGSLYLAFPSHNLTSYLHTVNLFEKFPTVVDANLPVQWNLELRMKYRRQAHRAATR